MSKSTTRSDDPSVSPEEQHRIEQFLYHEADLLDTFQLDDWLEKLTKDVVLRVPVRMALEPGAEQSQFSETSYYIRDDYEMLRERVGRLNKEYAWSENPRSRVRHVIGNVRIEEGDDGAYVVHNNQHVYRSYGDTSDHVILSAQRRTALRETGSGLNIADRTVYFDHSILGTKNLTLPLL